LLGSSSEWVHSLGSSSPFGLPDQPTIIGSVTIDPTKTGVDAFTTFDWVTGSMTWTLSDLVGGGATGADYAWWDPTLLVDFYFSTQNGSASTSFGSGDITVPLAYTSNTVAIDDGVTGVPVPEPATLSIFGVSLASTGWMRRRKKVA